MRVSSGALDWSGQAASGISMEDLDPLEIARARSFLRSRNPREKPLLQRLWSNSTTYGAAAAFIFETVDSSSKEKFQRRRFFR